MKNKVPIGKNFDMISTSSLNKILKLFTIEKHKKFYPPIKGNSKDYFSQANDNISRTG